MTDMCSSCQSVHVGLDVVAVGRFHETGPVGYRPATGGRLQSTREQAMSDVCAERAVRR